MVSHELTAYLYKEEPVLYKDWLTYYGGTDGTGELCYNFSISNNLTQMVNFITWIPECDSHRPALLDLFLFSDAIISSTMAFPPFSDHVLYSVSINLTQFPSNSQWDVLFHHITYDYSHAHWEGQSSSSFERFDIFKLSASTAASEFCEWVQSGIDLYIPHRKYQVKPDSCAWFSAACVAAIVHRNFCLY